MHDQAPHVLDHVPFFLSVASARAGQINGQRIVEAIIIAAISAVASAHITTARLEERMSLMTTTLIDLRSDMRRIESESRAADAEHTRWELRHLSESQPPPQQKR